MLARTYSVALAGLEGYLVESQVHIVSGLPALTVVGLPDASVKEARERVRSGLINSGFEFPKKRITVNLAPADIKKEGSAFDLAIGLGILAAAGSLDKERLAKYISFAELSLDGTCRALNGALLAAESAKKHGFEGMIVSTGNAREAAIIKGIDIIAIDSLAEAAAFLNSKIDISPTLDCRDGDEGQRPVYEVDFIDVKGQSHAKRALEIAAAGGHNCLMVGSPGAGKSMLAKRLPTILPDLSRNEAIEVTKIHSVAGLTMDRASLVLTRPFRSPHHTISYSGLAGGGANPRPGEITLSHNGVLFLDELPEFARNVIELLRQPLESGEITITRAASSAKFPCRFMLVAAMNPCPCGFIKDPIRPCICSGSDIHRYQRKISGPLLDRFDIKIEVPRLKTQELFLKDGVEGSGQIKDRVCAARLRQHERFKTLGADLLNSTIAARDLRKYLFIKPDASKFLEQLTEKYSLSGRAFDRILRVSRTIADLGSSPYIQTSHLAEAVQYRNEFLLQLTY